MFQNFCEFPRTQNHEGVLSKKAADKLKVEHFEKIYIPTDYF